ISPGAPILKKTTSLLVFFLPVVFAEADDGAHCVALSVLFHRAMPISEQRARRPHHRHRLQGNQAVAVAAFASATTVTGTSDVTGCPASR
ncbi:hypothetical protein, partial [Xanthomonas euvesicatoria]|uniref:hypothetical protein n=1 Tax=Xanthomonas euvesicatoria TaxID=456327 RepID=UPI001B80CAD2